jgi:hypothetical protein
VSIWVPEIISNIFCQEIKIMSVLKYKYDFRIFKSISVVWMSFWDSARCSVSHSYQCKIMKPQFKSCHIEWFWHIVEQKTTYFYRHDVSRKNAFLPVHKYKYKYIYICIHTDLCVCVCVFILSYFTFLMFYRKY